MIPIRIYSCHCYCLLQKCKASEWKQVINNQQVLEKVKADSEHFWVIVNFISMRRSFALAGQGDPKNLKKRAMLEVQWILSFTCSPQVQKQIH